MKSMWPQSLLSVHSLSDNQRRYGRYDDAAPCTLSLFRIFCGGAGTGILMVAAYKSKNFVVAVLGVMLFILCGFPHCIAECGYLRMDPLQWLMACLGNVAGGQLWRILDIRESA